MIKLVFAIMALFMPATSGATEKPIQRSVYKSGEVLCVVEIFKERIILRANNPYGYEGRTTHEVVLMKTGKILSSKNYIFAGGDKLGQERELTYPYFHRYCYKRHVTGNIPEAVRRVIPNPEVLLYPP